jgi:hypothetical protein
MPKPPQEIMAWIATLSPADELAVRMSICQNNPWCQEDKAWQLRIAELEAEFIHSPADRARFAERAAKMARDMDAVVRDAKEQAAAPPPVPAEPR